jgi:hypothetical protein
MEKKAILKKKAAPKKEISDKKIITYLKTKKATPKAPAKKASPKKSVKKKSTKTVITDSHINTLRDEILELIDTVEFPKAGFLEGNEFDKAIIGVEQHEGAVIYSLSKIIDILMEDGMDRDEAMEYYEYNIEGIRGNINFLICYDLF